MSRQIISAVFYSLALSVFLFGTPSTAQDADDSEDRNILSKSADFTKNVYSGTKEGLGNAATAPFRDLNLRRDHIPIELQDLRTPYDPIIPMTCENIGFEVRILNTLLSLDVDDEIEFEAREAEQDNEDDNENRFANKTSDFALDTVASEARGMIPFRGVVRYISGANSHDKKVQAAYDKGYLRRSFLKGVGLGLGCTYPAAPHPIDITSFEPTKAPIQYKGASPTN